MTLWTPADLAVPAKSILDPSTFAFSGSAFVSGADHGSYGGSFSGAAGQTTLNGINVCTFNGSSQQLAGPSKSWTAGDDVFIFLVVQANKLNPGAVVSQAWGTATTGWVLYPSLTSGGSTNGGQKSWVSGDSVAFGSGFGSASVQNVTIGHAYTSNAAYHLLALKVGTASLYRLDGVAQTPGAVTGANAAVTASVIWGSDALSEWFTGNIAYGLVGVNPSAGEIEKLEGWASWRFAGGGSMLPGGHTYASAAPTLPEFAQPPVHGPHGFSSYGRGSLGGGPLPLAPSGHVVTADWPVFAEAKGSVLADIVARLEAQAALAQTAPIAIEALQTETQDSRVAIEGLQTVRADPPLWGEAKGSPFADGRIGIEAIGSLVMTWPANVEALGTVRQDRPSGIEGLTTVTGQQPAGIEALTTGRQDWPLWEEWSGALIVTADVKVSLEFTGSPFADASVPVEAKASVAPAAATHVTIPGGLSPFFSTLTSAQPDPDGGTAAIKLVASAVNNVHGANTGPSGQNGRWLFSAKAKAGGQPRFGMRVFDGAAYQMRTTFDITNGTIVLVEAGFASIAPLVYAPGWYLCRVWGSTATGNMGAVSGFALETVAAGQTVQTVFLGDGVSGAFVYDVVAQPGFPNIDLPVGAEWGQALTADGLATIEATATARGDALVRLEAGGALVGDGRAALEAKGSLQGDTPARVEAKGALQADASGRLEALGSVQGMAPIQAEHLTGVAGAALVALEWIKFEIRRRLAIFFRGRVGG